MKLLFWISVALIAYTFVLYPLLLAALAGMAQLWADLRYAVARTDRRRNRRGMEPPTVSFIIAAHNEEAVIAGKMRNCAELDHPADRIEFLVGCDGCTDGTYALAQSAGLPNARIFHFERSGKPATLNRLVEEAAGDILVFSDANTMYRPDALRSLLRHFGSESVGGVCGELRLTSPAGEMVSEGMYWRYECFLKFLESRLNMLVGANGAIFAMRRSLHRPLPPRTINDDFIAAMNVRARGLRMIYDPCAIACEEAGGDVRQEFRRRVRIGRGNLRALRHTWRLLLPHAGLVALSYWSHKVFRWLAPFATLTALLSSVALAAEPFYAACAAIGLAFVALAAIGFWSSSPRASHPLVRIPCYFLVMNLGLLVGFLKDAAGSRSSTWNPTPRAAAGEGAGEAAAGTAEASAAPSAPVAGAGR